MTDPLVAVLYLAVGWGTAALIHHFVLLSSHGSDGWYYLSIGFFVLLWPVLWVAAIVWCLGRLIVLSIK